MNDANDANANGAARQPGKRTRRSARGAAAKPTKPAAPGKRSAYYGEPADPPIGRQFGVWVRARREELGLGVRECADRVNAATGWVMDGGDWTQIEGRVQKFPERAVFRAVVAALESTAADALIGAGLLPADASAARGDLDALVADLSPSERAAVRQTVAMMARRTRAADAGADVTARGTTPAPR